MKTDKPSRPRGTGYIWRNGRFYWCKFYDRGIPRRENTRCENEKDAEKFLKRRLAEVATETYVPRTNVRVDELAKNLLDEYEANGRKSTDHTRRVRWESHLKPFFTNRRAQDVTTDHVNRYVILRRGQGASNATINRELAFLRRAFNLGRRQTPPKVRTVPYVPMLKENNARQGFLADADSSKLEAECAKQGLWLRAMLAVASSFAWRRGEVVNLRVRQVDLLARTIRLEHGTTKNDQGRTVKMTDDVYTLIAHCVQGKHAADFVFTREDGQPIKDFRKAWRNACEAAGVPDLKFHDLRRTGARNLRRLGVAEGTIMKIGGWKTAAVFRRYDIVSEEDLADAARKLDEKRARGADGHSAGITAPKTVQPTTQADFSADRSPLPN